MAGSPIHNATPGRGEAIRAADPARAAVEASTYLKAPMSALEAPMSADDAPDHPDAGA
jgi:hypothetical protein